MKANKNHFKPISEQACALAIGCASFLIFLNAIPNVKYAFFQGTFDSAAHYGYVRDLVFLGHVPSTGFYAADYQDFPGMHILIGARYVHTLV